MLHLDDGLELLDDSSVQSENVVFHVSFGEEVSLGLEMVDDSDFISALFAASDAVVEDGAIEPIRVIEDDFLVLFFVVDSVG